MKIEDLPSLDTPGRISLARQLVCNFKTSLPRELYAGSLTLKSKLPFKATSLREGLIHRVTDLAEASVELYESDRIIPAFIQTRAVLETTALIFWLHQKTGEFLSKRDVQAYNEFLNKGILGSKDKSTAFESYNVLTAIDRLDKEFDGLRQMYDTLCEFTHPNWSGVLGAYSRTDKNKYTVRFGKEHRKPPITFGLNPLLYSLMIFEAYYNALPALLTSANDLLETGNK